MRSALNKCRKIAFLYHCSQCLLRNVSKQQIHKKKLFNFFHCVLNQKFTDLMVLKCIRILSKYILTTLFDYPATINYQKCSPSACLFIRDTTNDKCQNKCIWTLYFYAVVCIFSARVHSARKNVQLYFNKNELKLLISVYYKFYV